MLSHLKNNIKADCIILYNNNLVKGALVVGFLILSYMLYGASNIGEFGNPGYYFNQTCIVLAILNVFIMIIVSSFLGAMDSDYQTFSLRVVNSSRFILSLSRSILLIFLSLLLFIPHMIIGVAFDIINKTTTQISFHELFKVAGIILILVFWSSISYLFALITKNFSLTATIGIGYLLIESYVARFLPRGILQFLPVWNQKSFLKYFFPVQEGAIAIVQTDFADYKVSLCVIMLYLLLSVGLILRIGNKKQYL